MGLFVFHLQGCRRGKQSQWLPSTNYIFRVAGSMPAPSCALQNVTGELWFLAAWTLPIWVEHDEISRRPSHPAYYCDLSLKGEKNESLGFLSARNSRSWMVSWGPELWQVPVEVSVFRAAGCERKHWFAFCVSLLVCVCRGDQKFEHSQLISLEAVSLQGVTMVTETWGCVPFQGTLWSL